MAVLLVGPRVVRLPEHAPCAGPSDLGSATGERVGLRDCAAEARVAPAALEAQVAWPSLPDVLQVRFHKEHGAANVAEESFLPGKERNVDVLPVCEPVLTCC